MAATTYSSQKPIYEWYSDMRWGGYIVWHPFAKAERLSPTEVKVEIPYDYSMHPRDNFNPISCPIATIHGNRFQINSCHVDLSGLKAIDITGEFKGDDTLLLNMHLHSEKPYDVSLILKKNG